MEARERLIKELEQSARRAQQVRNTHYSEYCFPLVHFQNILYLSLAALAAFFPPPDPYSVCRVLSCWPSDPFRPPPLSALAKEPTAVVPLY